MKKLVVLTGAGISAESGLSTFRNAGGLWEGHDVIEVASPEGWRRNKELVLEFYNQRRRQMHNVTFNDAHKALVRLEEIFDVTVITQNVDYFHEKSGSSRVIHLHGELDKARSSVNPDLIYDLNGKDIKIGDKCEEGSQLRPHVVWFGEMVPMMEIAVKHCLAADIFIVIGTSLVVYPAASLLEFVPDNTKIYLIDPEKPEYLPYQIDVEYIQEKAVKGTSELVERLLKSA
ncbi:MAG: NAD-dependent deacylase [Ignavibacteria bacterium]|nr:NAD-dependent deacylase [Ignavibacteria bacterium]